MDAAEQEADAGGPRKKPAAGKRWGGEDDARGRDRDVSPAAPRKDAGKDGALAECAVSCCVFCACLPVAVLCCVARAPVRAARRCWRLRRRRPARRLAPGGSSSFSDAELGDLRQGRVRTMADEDGRAGSPRQPPHREEDRRR